MIMCAFNIHAKIVCLCVWQASREKTSTFWVVECVLMGVCGHSFVSMRVCLA